MSRDNPIQAQTCLQIAPLAYSPNSAKRDPRPVGIVWRDVEERKL